MFTGIIETIGRVQSVMPVGSNVDIWVDSPITPELKIDQSVAHNGVCLTVVEIKGSQYRVTAVAETLTKTNLGQWKKGDEINLERSLRVGDRLDGHFVQGHIDAVIKCIGKQDMNGSWLFSFQFPQEYAALVIEKGSVCLNGVSLTAFNISANELSVAIIPYTYEHTNFHNIGPDTIVNVEFDVLGKYLLRSHELAG